MPAELDSYIAKAREKKFSDEQIKNQLLSSGWQQDQITQALAQNPTDTSLPPPPPPPVPHVGMWTGFLYVIFFICLYVLATAIGILFHNWVDTIFPLPTDMPDYWGTFRQTELQGALAAIIVSFPIFAYLAILLKKQLAKNPAIKNIRSRKLLIYITLVGTFLIMLSHIIGTIFSFLNGSANVLNALAHLGVTLLIAGSIFGYFISEVKHDSNT